MKKDFKGQWKTFQVQNMIQKPKDKEENIIIRSKIKSQDNKDHEKKTRK